MVFAPGPRFTNVFQWFLTSGLLWASFFNGFSILLLAGSFRASFPQCFSTLLLSIPPEASLSTWYLTCIQCSYGFSPLLPKASSLDPGLLYSLQECFSFVTASISVTWFAAIPIPFLGRAWLQSVITHFVEPAECIFDFSDLTYFSVCSGVARLRNLVVAMFVNMFVQHSPRAFIFWGWRRRFAQNLALGYILNQVPVWTFKHIVDLKHASAYFLVVALGLVEASGFGLIPVQEASFANSFSIFCGLNLTQFLIIFLCN